MADPIVSAASNAPTPSPARCLRVLLNVNAGSKAGLPTNAASEERVRAAMSRHGLGDELILTTSKEDAVAATREAAALGYAAVVAAGGDGTVGPVARELLGQRTALGLLPLGSVMNIARMLGIPRELDQAAAVVAAGHLRTIDVCEAKGEIFFEGGSVGLTAAVFREAQRIDAGHYRALAAALWVLVGYRPGRLALRLDQGRVRVRALAVVVANGPYTGLGFTVAPDARLDDGRFDVRVFRRFSRWDLVRHFRAIAFGHRRYTPRIDTYRSARVEITAAHPHACRADAHDLGQTPVAYIIHPAALRVLAPPSPLRS